MNITVHLTVAKEGDFRQWSAKCRELGIAGYGLTKELALSHFESIVERHFVHFWPDKPMFPSGIPYQEGT